MTVVNPKSISGINSITTGSGSDDILTIHTNNGTERLRIDSTGTTKIVTGIVTTLTATTGIVTTFEATTGNITTLRAPTGIVTTFTADTARINTTSLASTKLSIQSTATSGSGSACGLRVGNNVSGALTKYPAEVEIRTTGVQDYNALRTDAGDGNGGFTAGVQGYNGFLNLTTGGTDVVNVKFSADANTDFFNGSNGFDANVGIGTTVVGSSTNLTLGRRDNSNEGGELGFCRSNDGTQYWQIDCYGGDDSPALRFHNSNSTKVAFPASGGIAPSGELTAANVLDDYEEGTWTPDLQFGGSNAGITYGSRYGYYTKIGQQVTVIGRIGLSNKGSASGAAKFEGLPFATKSISGTQMSIGSIWYNNMQVQGTHYYMVCRTDGNATTFVEPKNVSYSSEDAVDNSDFGNNTDMTFTITYLTS